ASSALRTASDIGWLEWWSKYRSRSVMTGQPSRYSGAAMAIREETPTRVTHGVENQPPPLADYNVFEQDPALREALDREGGGWAVDRIRELGAVAGSARTIE